MPGADIKTRKSKHTSRMRAPASQSSLLHWPRDMSSLTKKFCRRQAVGVWELRKLAAAWGTGALSGGCQRGRAQPHSQMSGEGLGWLSRAQVTSPAHVDETCPQGSQDCAGPGRPRKVKGWGRGCGWAKGPMVRHGSGFTGAVAKAMPSSRAAAGKQLPPEGPDRAQPPLRSPRRATREPLTWGEGPPSLRWL